MIHQMSREELISIYENHMEKDFPDNELKPLFVLLDYFDKKRMDAITFEFEGKTVGYGTLVFADNYLLLDYLAVFDEERGKGYGKLFLKEMQSYYHNYDAIFLESEAYENEEAKNRLAFYDKAGCICTDLIVQLWHVPYHILMLPIHGNVKDIRETMKKVYLCTYDKEYMGNNVKIL